MSHKKRSPFRSSFYVAVLAWALPLATWLFIRYESGYFFTQPPEMKDDRDQGFRLEASDAKGGHRLCSGFSPAWLGPCGNIEGRSLSHVFLKEYNADGLKLSLVIVEKSRWEWVSVQLAKLSKTHFFRVALNDVDLSSSELNDVKFREGIWRGSRLNSAVLKDVIFENVQMEDVSFRGAQFERVRFKGGSCIRCDFRDVVFANSSIEGNFYNSIYNQTSVLPFPLDEIGIRHFHYIE